jgi:hypothetical protein
MGRKIVTAWEVTEYEPNQTIGFRVTSGPLPFQGKYAFETVDGGTRVTLTARAATSGLSRLFEPVAARLGKRQYKNDFATLKELLERQA